MGPGPFTELVQFIWYHGQRLDACKWLASSCYGDESSGWTEPPTKWPLCILFQVNFSLLHPHTEVKFQRVKLKILNQVFYLQFSFCSGNKICNPMQKQKSECIIPRNNNRIFCMIFKKEKKKKGSSWLLGKSTTPQSTLASMPVCQIKTKQWINQSSADKIKFLSNEKSVFGKWMQQEPGNGDQTGQRPPALWEHFCRTPDWSVLFSMHFVTGNNTPLRLSTQDCSHQWQQRCSNRWGSLGQKTQNNLFYSGCHQLDLAAKSKQLTHFQSDHRVTPMCWRVEHPMIWGRLSFQTIIVRLALIASDTSSYQWRCGINSLFLFFTWVWSIPHHFWYLLPPMKVCHYYFIFFTWVLSIAYKLLFFTPVWSIPHLFCYLLTPPKACH